jgi:ABC-type spermidine/putrescine transport system permease subunit I
MSPPRVPAPQPDAPVPSASSRLERLALSVRHSMRRASDAVERLPSSATTALLLFPAVLVVGAFLAAFIAFGQVSVGGGPSEVSFPTGEYFERVLSQPALRASVTTSLKLGAVVAAICLVVGYALAYFLHRSRTRYRPLLLALLFVPLQLNAVVRVFGWHLFLAEPNGPLNSVLTSIGLGTVSLNNSFWGIVITLVHVNLLFMVLPLLVSMDRIDPAVEQAAEVSGANFRRTFLHVTLPLSLPGAIAGTLVVAVLATFDFVTASLMGGGRVPLLPVRAFDEIIGSVNWAQGAALSVVGLAACLVLVVLLERLAGRLLYERREARA